MQDVKINLVAGAQDAVGIDMRMGTGAFPANGVDALHILRPQLVQHLVDQGHAIIFPHSGPQFQIQGIIGGVHHSASGVQQGDFILGFDAAGFQHQLLAVHYIQPLFLQGEQHYRLHHIHAHRFVLQAAQFQFNADFPGYIRRQVSRRRRSPPQSGNAGPGAFPQPGAVNLMMPRRRAEIPQNRLVLLGQQGKAHQLVHGPSTDNGGGQVADVVHIEGEQRAQLRLFEQLLGPGQPLGAEPLKVNPFLPVHAHSAEALDLRHGYSFAA